MSPIGLSSDERDALRYLSAGPKRSVTGFLFDDGRTISTSLLDSLQRQGLVEMTGETHVPSTFSLTDTGVAALAQEDEEDEEEEE